MARFIFGDKAGFAELFSLEQKFKAKRLNEGASLRGIEVLGRAKKMPLQLVSV